MLRHRRLRQFELEGGSGDVTYQYSLRQPSLIATGILESMVSQGEPGQVSALMQQMVSQSRRPESFGMRM